MLFIFSCTESIDLVNFYLTAATPKATVIRQPVKIGGRSTIGCSLLGSNHVGCRSMYWVANGTVLHDGLGYNMTFLQSYCLGHLTFYAYSPAEIRCLIELISGNATALNSTSGIVIIRVPNEIGLVMNYVMIIGI